MYEIIALVARLTLPCRLDIPNFKPEAEEGAGRAGEGQEHMTSTRNISPTRETESFSHLQVAKKKKRFYF